MTTKDNNHEKSQDSIESTKEKCYTKLLFDNSILLTTKEAAKYLRLSENALRLRVYREGIPRYRLGTKSIRYKKSDLDGLLHSSEEL